MTTHYIKSNVFIMGRKKTKWEWREWVVREKFLEKHSENLKYVHDLGVWMVVTQVWREAEPGEVEKMVLDVAEEDRLSSGLPGDMPPLEGGRVRTILKGANSDPQVARLSYSDEIPRADLDDGMKGFFHLFLSECCDTTAPGNLCRGSVLFKAFCSRTDQQHWWVPSARDFHRWMRECGFRSHPRNGYETWEGVALRAPISLCE